MSETKIFGVCLVKNEENFIAWALSNVADFCDEILVMDNRSEDQTRPQLDAVSNRFPHIRVMTVDDAYDTHRHVEHLANTKTWVIGVDGDEIYDRAALARLRTRLLAGEFDEWWRIYGHTIHTLGLDFENQTAFGYVPPAARSITKLYNFAAITSWHQPRHERLHGKDMKFHPGYSRERAHALWRDVDWAQSDFRCLHMCFQPRSSLDAEGIARANPVEVKKAGKTVRRLTDSLMRRFDPSYDLKKNYKNKHYAIGQISSGGIDGFGRPTDVLDLAPGAASIETMLADLTSTRESLR